MSDATIPDASPPKLITLHNLPWSLAKLRTPRDCRDCGRWMRVDHPGYRPLSTGGGVNKSDRVCVDCGKNGVPIEHA